MTSKNLKKIVTISNHPQLLSPLLSLRSSASRFCHKSSSHQFVDSFSKRVRTRILLKGNDILLCSVFIFRSVPFTFYLFIFISLEMLLIKDLCFSFLFISLLIFFSGRKQKKNNISTWGVSESFFCCHHYYGLGIILSLIPTKLILNSLGRAKQ